MFEPGLTKGMLEVFVAPTHHPHCSADDQSTKAIDIQNAYLNGMLCLPPGRDFRFPFDRARREQEDTTLSDKFSLLTEQKISSGGATRKSTCRPLDQGSSTSCTGRTDQLCISHLCMLLASSEQPEQGLAHLGKSVPVEPNSGVGDFSVWEFSGNPVYFCCYDYFAANDPTSIHVVVFSLEEPYEIQLNQVIFWLSFLKSLVPVEEPIAFGGKLKNPLQVVLVATHADIMNVPRPAGGEFGYDKDTSLLKEIRNRSHSYDLEHMPISPSLCIHCDEAEPTNCRDGGAFAGKPELSLPPTSLLGQ
ncbi:Death-associated protein kinase 1 [Saguinus oedipus]|uniref:Death-associated protein kinase 1 n=1 Tax=Saguinus oedipus TaxID=9490 RepID=A0ABQ9WEP9_SAGOE|nr:Death-associated protein kinase 1 [Saguinus oedipus]